VYPPACRGTKMEIPASGSPPRKEEAFAGIPPGHFRNSVDTGAQKEYTPIGCPLALVPASTQASRPFSETLTSRERRSFGRRINA